MTDAYNQHVSWPPERFYWGVIDTSVLAKRIVGGTRSEQLRYLFEDVLPVPVDAVQTTFLKLDSDRILACGLPASVLDTDVPTDAITLVPAQAPKWLNENFDASQLNLLIGPYEPKPLQRTRRKVFVTVASVIVVCSLLLCLGLTRRTRHIRDNVAAIEQSHVALIAQALDDDSINRRAALSSADLRLMGEYRRMRQTRDDSAPLSDPDIAPMLAQLLSYWPADLKLQTQRISVTSRSMTINTVATDTSESEAFIRALAQLTDWVIQSPTIQSRRDGVDVTVHCVPATAERDTARVDDRQLSRGES